MPMVRQQYHLHGLAYLKQYTECCQGSIIVKGLQDVVSDEWQRRISIVLDGSETQSKIELVTRTLRQIPDCLALIREVPLH